MEAQSLYRHAVQSEDSLYDVEEIAPAPVPALVLVLVLVPVLVPVLFLVLSPSLAPVLAPVLSLALAPGYSLGLVQEAAHGTAILVRKQALWQQALPQAQRG